MSQMRNTVQLCVLIMLSLSANAFRTGWRGFRSLGRATRLYSSGTSNESPVVWKSKTDCWRPDKQDVERISWGKPAKQKGTGSRGVPHRLNSDERVLFEQARRKGFLEVVGSGWRSERREAPLLNTHRSWCDARGQACLRLHKGLSGAVDTFVLDLSPLRMPEDFQAIAETCLHQIEGGTVYFQEDMLEALDAWESQPIYRLPPFRIEWELSRADAKTLGKTMASWFDTVEGNVATSKKPVGVKHGKSRRHGGYGIG